VALSFVSCSSSEDASGPLKFTDSPYSNVDAANTRDAKSSIRGANVPSLGLTWSLPIEAEGVDLGGYVATPVIAAGVAYSQDQESNVQAIDLASGDVLWEKTFEAAANGPNGVVVAAGRVYGATPTEAFALDEKTGEELWSESLVRNRFEQIVMAPGYHRGLVYFATSPVSYKGEEVGVLWALNARSGEKAWHFDTVPRSLWGRPEINFGGGLSYAPAFDNQGFMYFGTGNAGPFPGTERYPWGASRPGSNLYSDSIVKLDAKTGELQWYYQLTPHGLCNWDLGAPVLVEAGGRRLVIGSGLSGIVVALDRETGRPVWKRPVGVHNGHDDDGLVAMRGGGAKLRTPMTVYPGKFGGVLAPVSTDGSTVFVPVVNGATVLNSQREATEAGSPRGELVALNVASGAVRWRHDFPAPLYGATTATNDLVFASSFDGTLYAFDGDSGGEVWSESLPASINAGLSVSGNTLLAPAGYAGEGQTPELLAYRLGS
jgi:outer membrane protein assembly factor BamB